MCPVAQTASLSGIAWSLSPYVQDRWLATLLLVLVDSLAAPFYRTVTTFLRTIETVFSLIITTSLPGLRLLVRLPQGLRGGRTFATAGLRRYAPAWGYLD